MTKTKPDQGFWKLWNLSFGFFGVQIAYALQSANITRIFATIGADPHSLSFFWILPPLMGIIVQPIVGSASDRTWNRLGRRLPYLLIGAAVAVIVMCLLPNAGSFGLTISGAMVFGFIALMFLDTSINMAMQPFKMLVGDQVNERQKGLAYSIQSFLCNAGSLVGYLAPFVILHSLRIFSKIANHHDGNILVNVLGDESLEIVEQECNHVRSVVHIIFRHGLADIVLAIPVAAKRMAFYDSFRGDAEDIAGIELDLPYFEQRRHVLRKSEYESFPLNFDYIIERTRVQKHRRNSAVYVIERVGLKIHQTEHSREERALGQIESDEFVDFRNQFFEIVRSRQEHADDGL